MKRLFLISICVAGAMGVGAMGVGCGELGGDDLFGTTHGSTASASVTSGGTTSSTSSTSGAGGMGGAGGTGPATSGVSASSSDSVAASSSTGACVPKTNPCGALCGVAVFDGCEQVACNCKGADVCGTNGTCCTPVVANCAKKCNVSQSNTCGGFSFCDGQCGIGTWQSCVAGACACTDAKKLPGADIAAANCDIGKNPFYCGDGQQPDAPANCKFTGAANQYAPGNPWLWCCG